MVVVSVGPRAPGTNEETHLYGLTLGGGRLSRISVDRDPDCPSMDAGLPAPLSDGRLAYRATCFGSRLRPVELRNSLRVHDFGTGKTRLLRPYRLPFFAGRFAFSPTAEVGLLNDGAGLQEQLHWLDRRALRLLRLPVTRVGTPAWSWDGRRIVIDAVPKEAGPDSPFAMETPWSLYILDQHGRILRRLASDLRDEASSSWSPDGRWLVARTRPEGLDWGLWLFRVDGEAEPLLLRRGEAFGVPKWISNREIVVPVGVTGTVELGYRGPVGLYVIRLPRLLPED